MAAQIFLQQDFTSRKSPINRSGVLVLAGFGIRAQVNAGHLLLHDGIADLRRTIRLPRVGHGLRRLVIMGSDGFISLQAVRWLADQGVAITILQRDGKVLAVTGPVSPSDAKLRRAQALALSNGTALRMARELICQKLAGQEQVTRHKLLDSTTADMIAQFMADLPGADSIASVRLIESQAARAYWSAWSALPINFPKKDLRRTPEHWFSFGARVSPLTGSPRLAANPPNAILNLLYSILEAEARLAAAAMGLDPGLGFLHVDTSARDSLACDLMEPVRARAVDAYLLDWITQEPLKRESFFELGNGNCRLSSAFAAQLCETAPIWGRAVAPIAEWAAREFWKTIRKPDSPLATRLTQNNKRNAKEGMRPFPRPSPPVLPHVCLVCGKTIRRKHDYCRDCAAKNSTACLISGARLGREAAQTAQAQERRRETKRLHDRARKAWSSASQPAWLTRESYSKLVLPSLGRISLSKIASTIGVSIPYASDIRRGRRIPDQRHWQALAKLAGISESASN